MAKVEQVEAFGWKHCVRITGDDTEVIVTTDVGPRLISLRKGQGPNHLKVFDDMAGKSGDASFLLYGGHRVWHAPEQAGRTDLPDNRPCHYALTENGVIVCADADKAGIVKGMEVSVSDDGEVTVENILRNEGLFDAELAIWGLTLFEVGGLLAVPNSRLNTGLLPNRCVALWPYAKMDDRRVYWGDKFVTVKPDTQDTPPFKFGLSDDEQYAGYFHHGQLVVKRFDYYYGVEYPSYACNFESYTNDRFIEIESLSPLFTLEQGDEARHVEKWRVYDGIACPDARDEAAIERAFADVRPEK